MERVDDADLATVQEALIQLRTAQAVLDFMGRHVSRKYNLSGRDRFHADTGEITRGATEVKEPA